MVSLGLMVILMLAVNYIFSNVSRATSATQAFSRATRDAQSAQAVMFRDFAAADMENAPFVLLRSSAMPAFRNAADRLAGPDTVSVPPNPLWVVDPNGSGNGSVQISAATYNERNHRLDIVSFFSRDAFQRQTGGGTMTPSGTFVERFVDPMSCPEAWIWYGHLVLPTNSGTFTYSSGQQVTPGSVDPGSPNFGSNPNNYYASQFTLGRFQMLLQDPDANGKIQTREPSGSSATVPPVPPQMEHVYFLPDQRDGISDLWPFRYDTRTSLTTAITTLRESRYDLAGTSMGTYRAYLQDYISSPLNAGVNWWDRLMLAYRFEASPFILNTGSGRLTPEAVAKQAPIFLPGCSQFIVEYAGDFIAQDNDTTSSTYGELTNVYFDTGVVGATPGTDGIVDYMLDDKDNRSIRWYGLPRDTNADGRILGAPPAVSPRPLAGLRDVLPLRDILRTAGAPAGTIAATLKNPGTIAPFERLAATDGVAYDDVTNSTLRYLSDYATVGAGGMQSNEYYTCAWGPAERKPSMFRITFVLDDPEGQLSDPQTFEYIFKVQ
jgi:hypothetical protein